MNILYITNEVNLTTGWGVVGYYTIKEMVKKHKCDVITLKNAYNEKLKKVEYFPCLTTTSDTKLKMLIMIKDFIVIKNKLDLTKYDLVHILIEPLLPLSLFLSNQNILFNIVGTYSDLSFSQGFNKIFYNQALKKIKHIISISEYTKKRFELSSNYNSDITVIPLGVDTEIYNSNKSVKKENAICFVGHIKERKGLFLLLKAFKTLLKDKDDIKLYLIGSDEKDIHADKTYLGECKEFIEKNNLSKYITFTGQVTESSLIEYYQKSKVNVLASKNIGKHFEGFGLVHLEANALGTLTIGTLDSGNESAIIDGETGFLIKQNCEEELTNKLKFIFNMSEEEYNKYSSQCIKYAISQDWKNYAQRVDIIYGDQL